TKPLLTNTVRPREATRTGVPQEFRANCVPTGQADAEPAKARVRKQAASVIKRLRMDHLLDVFDQGEKSNHYHKHTHQGTHCPLNCVEVVYKELPHVHPSLSGFGAGGGAGFAVVILLSTALRRLSSPSSLEFRLSMPDFRPFMESAR